MDNDNGALIDTLQDRVNQALLTGDWHTLSDLVAPDALIGGWQLASVPYMTAA